MGHLEWSDRSAIDVAQDTATAVSGSDAPVLIAGFAGWSNAGDAATAAIEHLWEQWDARTIASIDPEEFYDFTTVRPMVRVEEEHRVLDWPANEFGWAEPAGTTGVLLLRGVEPQLRWRTFCDQVMEVAEVLGCRWVLSLGSLLSDVPHTRATPVFGTSDDAALRDRLVLAPSSYEGPTGILGALHAACAGLSIPTAALWAAVPSYAPTSPSPKATAALVERTADLLGAPIDTGVLDLGSVSYEHQLNELVADDEATSEYVRMLERQHDADPGSGGLDGADADRLLDEVERFLRDH